jgi:transcriptional regulator GlxA family with amidase domain
MTNDRGPLARIMGRRLLACSFFVILIFALVAQAEEPMHVGFLVLDHVYNSELMAPYDVFHHTVFHTKPGMKVFTVSLDGKSITTYEGLRISTDYSITNAPAIDVLVIPSAEHNMDSDLKNASLKNWVTSIATKARYVVTLCDGAFILANTGLLNGKKATTFPSDVAAFRKLFPQVLTQEGYSFVHDGKFLTSQGGARSYDVAMYLIDLMYGEKVAAGVGKGLILSWPQPSLKYLKSH